MEQIVPDSIDGDDHCRREGLIAYADDPLQGDGGQRLKVRLYGGHRECMK